MFGGELVCPPKCRKKKAANPKKQDILMPSTTPGYYGHYARQPNTNQHVQLLHYEQKRRALDDLQAELGRNQALQDNIEMKYEKHVQKKRFQRAIQDRVNEKWKAYEATVEARRKRLQELLCKEERQLYWETVNAAQKGADEKMQEMKQRADMLKARKEKERLAIVHQKRIEQYRDRCQELRPHLAKRHLIESKHGQLQQMRENEARREADRELERMWYELTLKEERAKKEREVQEMLQRRNKQKEIVHVWDKQIKAKELLKAEMDRVAQEDRLEMQALSEQLRKEEIEALDNKRRKRDEATRQILEQIEQQKQLQAQRKKEENALEQAYTTLAQLEIEREKASITNATEQAKRESALYRKHLKDLEEERKAEEKQLAELLEIYRKEIEAKQTEAQCKIIEAKRKLQQDVLAGRAEQIKYKQQEAEQQLKLKQAENELLRMSYDTNERLQAESDRLQRQAEIQYRDDLKKQIEYNSVLRQREREEMERMLAKGLEEEEHYRQIVEQMLKGEIDCSAKHPFRKASEQYDCRCPNDNK